MQYPEHILKLIAVFKKFPGIGAKSAERFAFHLIDWPEDKLKEMSQIIEETPHKLTTCEMCGSLIDTKQCPFCSDSRRNHELLCLVASAKDVFLIEQTHEFRGMYHVLGTLLSPLHGSSLDQKALEKLKHRILQQNVKELILAFDSTLEGDATALFLKKELESIDIITSRLALGLPMGSSLEFIDGGTLARALAGRHIY